MKIYLNKDRCKSQQHFKNPTVAYLRDVASSLSLSMNKLKDS